MVDTLKSPSITNLDALNPGPVYNTTGLGGPSYYKEYSDYVVPTTGGLVLTTSTYRVVRVPCNAKIKDIRLTSDVALAASGLAFDVGAYYSDSTVDGTAVLNQGVLISANCFAAILPFSTTFQDVSAIGSFSVVNRNKELWAALGLATNPGGYIDIVLAVHTIAVTPVSSNLEVQVKYVT